MKKRFIALTACLFLLCSCDFEGDYLAYQKNAIEAEVDFTINDRSFSALVELSAPVGEDISLRDAKITFTAPENLAGVTVKRGTASSSVSLGGIEIPLVSPALAGFFDIADAFSIDGTLEKIETSNGENVLLITAANGNYTVFLDVEKKIPKRIDVEAMGRTIEMNVKNFTKK